MGPKRSSYVVHTGVLGMKWGRHKQALKDWANGKAIRVGQGNMSNRQFDRQVAKEMGISTKQLHSDNKKFGAQRAAVFKKLGVGSEKVKDVLRVMGHNVRPGSVSVERKRKGLQTVNAVLGGAILAGLTLKMIKEARDSRR